MPRTVSGFTTTLGQYGIGGPVGAGLGTAMIRKHSEQRQRYRCCTVTSSVGHSVTDGSAPGNPGSRRRIEDLKSRRRKVELAQLAERDEARVHRVRARERISSDGSQRTSIRT